jgi:hypothetical protein
LATAVAGACFGRCGSGDSPSEPVTTADGGGDSAKPDVGGDTGKDGGGGTGGADSAPDSASDGPSDGGGDAGENLAACTALAKQSCELLFNCYPALGAFQMGDLTQCEPLQVDSCMMTASAKGSGDTPAGIAVCGAAFATCTDLPFEHPECTMPGTLDDGVSCLVNDQCKSGTCARLGENIVQCGIRWSGGALDAPCSNNTTCARHLCFSGKCVEYAAEGKPCGTSTPHARPTCCAPIAFAQSEAAYSRRRGGNTVRCQRPTT